MEKEKRDRADKEEKEAGRAIQPPALSSVTSDNSVLVDGVCQAIRAEFLKNFKTLGINPEVQEKSAQLYPTIDLVTPSNVSPALSQPSIIPRSPISVASTPSHARNGGSALGFSHLTHMATVASPSTMFATTQWKPKESPYFYGRSTEDVHTWTSLVHHYLTFMGGSEAHQVVYSITLLCDSVHEWYIGYEKRSRRPPRDWA